jgi:hypothetical protein
MPLHGMMPLHRVMVIRSGQGPAAGTTVTMPMSLIQPVIFRVVSCGQFSASGLRNAFVRLLQYDASKAVRRGHARVTAMRASPVISSFSETSSVARRENTALVSKPVPVSMTRRGFRGAGRHPAHGRDPRP